MIWLRRNEWTIVGCLVMLAFTLGVLGMRRQMAVHDTDASWADAVFFSLRLFTAEYDLSGEGSPYAVDNWLLQLARFLAPAALAYAVVKGLMLAAAYRLNLWRVSRWQGHAVVCGAGERGRRLALSLRQEGHRVVVIERDEHAGALSEIRASGARVVLGSGTDLARQAEARLDYAGIVASVTPCQESNLQVVLAANRRRTILPVRALAHATRSFAEMFETQPPFARIVGGRDCGFFNHEVAAARVLMSRYAPDLVPSLLEERRAPRLLLAGDGDVLPKLLGIAVAQCQYAGGDVPCIDLVIADTDAFDREFPLHHTQLDLVADLRVHALPRPHLLRLQLTALQGKVREQPYDLAFVACREDIDTLTLSKNLVQQTGCISRDVIAGLRPSSQLMRLFIDDQPLAGVQSHDLVALGCSADVVLRGRLDQVARRIHEAYLTDELKGGQLLGSTPSLVPWEELPEALRNANRAQADHIPIKQRTLALSRSNETIEAIAVAEHRRWMAEKIVAGWRYAPDRDDVHLLHSSIKLYDELTDSEKEKDRNTVMAVVVN